MKTNGRRPLGFAIAVVAWVAVVAAALATTAFAARWVIHGRGLGHGVGMSQYGAYGYAKHGRGYRSILGHYYRHTRVGTANGHVRVLLASGVGSVDFSKARRACGERLQERRDYRFADSGSSVVLRSPRGRKLASCGHAGTARGGNGIRVGGKGTYRGELKAKETHGLLVVNRVGVDDYARGVIANEMSSSWPQDALRAQAVATRSYGLSSTGGSGFDVYDDTRSQVYGGKRSETRATDRAVRATRDEVLRYHKHVITAFFFSTSGGQTESANYVFGSAPVPYLKSVNDPFDDVSPFHKWKMTRSRHQMESRLDGLFEGRLRKIKVTKTGDSPRIVKARVVGSGGSSRVSGSTLQRRLGLMSTWARFRRR